MKKILWVVTIPRVGERIWPAMAKMFGDFNPDFHTDPEGLEYNMDCLMIDQMSFDMDWYGDKDPREYFYNHYEHYFSNIWSGPGPCSQIDPVPRLSKLDFKKYDLIIADDNRVRNGLDYIYSQKRPDAIMIGNSHGNTDKNYVKDGIHRAFDFCFVFGEGELLQTGFRTEILKGGIPSNDKLSQYKDIEKEHILVIVNFLGNRGCPFKVKFDQRWVDDSGLVDLANGSKIVVKLKARLDENSKWQKNIDYVRSLFPEDVNLEVIVDVEDDNELIAKSELVLSAPSTMAFKAIQLGIPTVLIKGSGQVGLFEDFPGLVDLDSEQISTELCRQAENGKEYKFIDHHIEGGTSFESTKAYVDELKKFL